jgi:hypothetical protein
MRTLSQLIERAGVAGSLDCSEDDVMANLGLIFFVKRLETKRGNQSYT